MPATALVNQVTPANAANLVGRGQIPASYIVWDDGAKFHADSMIGGADYTSVDHTDATTIIQNAIQAVFNAGGGAIGFIAGSYPINGPFVTTGDGSSFGQLIIPANNVAPMITISFVALSYAVGPYLETSSLNETGQVILYSQSSGSNNNYYLMNVALGSFLGNTSNVYLYFNGVVFRTGQTKQCGGLNVFYAVGLSFGSLAFDTDNQQTVKSQNSVAFAWSNNGNVNGSQHGDSLTIVGYQNALATSGIHMSLNYYNSTRNTTTIAFSGGAAGQAWIGMLETNLPSTIITTDNHTFRLKIDLLSQVDTPTNTIVNCQAGSTFYADIAMVASASITMTNTLPTNGFVRFRFVDANTLPVVSGVLTAGASPFTAPQQGYDYLFVLQVANGLSAATLDGVTITLSINTSILIKAGHALVLTWAATAPTYKVLPQ